MRRSLRNVDDVFTNFENAINNLFNYFNQEFIPNITELVSGYPKTSIREQGGDYIIDVELPNITSDDDVEVFIENNSIIIQGTYQNERSIVSMDGKRKKEEKIYQKFYKSIPLEKPISANGAKATYKNGILQIKAIKSNESRIENKLPIEFL